MKSTKSKALMGCQSDSRKERRTAAITARHRPDLISKTGRAHVNPATLVTVIECIGRRSQDQRASEQVPGYTLILSHEVIESGGEQYNLEKSISCICY